MFGSKKKSLIEPMDAHNQALLDNVHPSDWKNPKPAKSYNMVVIGAGSAGLITAAAAAGLGAKVALIEKALLGGDCLNSGCVPSKLLIRAGKAAKNVEKSQFFGIESELKNIDFPLVMERVRRIRSEISHHDSAERFSKLGIDVFIGEAKFENESTVTVGKTKLNFKKACIATGASPRHMPIDGLEKSDILTNENIFNLVEQPESMAIVGGGPIGCELAQAFARLGTRVYLLEKNNSFLPREDPDAAKILLSSLKEDGVEVITNTTIFSGKKSKENNTYKLFYSTGAEEELTLEVDKILMAIGRTANVDNLDLEKAGVEFSKHGVTVNDNLQTSNPNIFAAGDVCLKHKFTHAADFAARIVVQNALFFGRKKLSVLTIPWATYTDPEVAHVGIYGHQSEAEGVEVDTYTKHFSDVDRAILESETSGFVRVHTKKGSDKILGATIVGPHAGDQISEISLAMATNAGLAKISNVIHPYPTQSEAIRQVGDMYNKTRLSPFLKKTLSTLLRFRR